MDPIVIEFEASCSPQHAFELWTSRPGLWWPKSHTLSQEAVSEILFEPLVGGRIHEVDVSGVEHDWGEITLWDPPHRVDYLWHLFFDRSEATNVSVTFTATEAGVRVRLEQSGFDRLPADVGIPRRNRTEGAWQELTELYRRALA